MATLFRNTNFHLSLIADAFSRLHLQSARSSIAFQQPTQCRCITSSNSSLFNHLAGVNWPSARDSDCDPFSPKPTSQGDGSSFGLTSLPLPAYTYGTKLKPRRVRTMPQTRRWTTEEDGELMRLVKEGRPTHSIYADHFQHRTYGAVATRAIYARKMWRAQEQRQQARQGMRGGDIELGKKSKAGGKEEEVGISLRSVHARIFTEKFTEQRETDKTDDTVIRRVMSAKDPQRRGKWTPEEDVLLQQLIQKYKHIPDPMLWSKVSGGKIDGPPLLRAPVACDQRWKVLRPSPLSRSGLWTSDEERHLQEAISEQFEGKYQVIIDVLVGKPATTTHSLGAWRPELVQLPGQEGLPILKQGSRRLRMLNWLAIAEKVRSRRERDCRGHFYQVYHNANRGALTLDEKARLMEGLKMYGKDYWKIAEHVGTRSPIQVTKIVSRLKQEKRTDRTAGSSSDKE